MSAEVIKYLRRKNSNGFDTVSYFGAEQRFVSPIRNSSLNNLEEQFILGTDSYTEVYEDANENIIIEKNFYINNDAAGAEFTDYYKLISTIYKQEGEGIDPYYTASNIDFINGNKVLYGIAGDVVYGDITEIYLKETKARAENNSVNITPDTAPVTLREDRLYFVHDDEATKTLVTTKQIIKDYDTIDNKMIIKEIINNNLTS